MISPEYGIADPATLPRIEADRATAILASLDSPGYEKTGESYVCPLCEKQFGYKNGLIRHLRITHIKEKPYECNICHRRFGYKNILLEHQNIHFGIKPYACTMCDKRFAARSNLIQHRMTHRKPFSCYLCNKKFDKDEQLQRHLLAHPRGMLSCDSCGFTAPNQEDLSHHILEAHAPQVMHTRVADRVRTAHEAMNEYEGGDNIDMRSLPLNHTNQGPLPSFDTFQMRKPGTSPLPLASPMSALMTIAGANMNSISSNAGAGKRLENLCSQLATRSGSFVNEQISSVVTVKQEQLSPLANRSHPTFAESSISLSPSPGASVNVGQTYPLQAGLTSATLSTYSSPGAHSRTSSLSDHLSLEQQPQHFSHGMPGQSQLQRRADAGSRRSSDSMPLEAASTSFALSPLRSDSINISGAADSTTNVTELLSTLQNILNRSHDPISPGSSGGVPQISINVGPKAPARSVAVQHSGALVGYPEPDDILTYLVSQGKLFECKHCGILFRERGLFFLHTSLHDANNPWQCSICHTLCRDKNDFNLHFVNQQHA